MTAVQHAVRRQHLGVEGWTASGFEALRDALVTNLRTGEEYGAAVSVYRHGIPVVDLWGGTSDDAGSRYLRDALQVGYSVTKGVVGLVLARLVADGVVDLDQPVCAYWPEFAAEGKGTTSVAELASHQGGLPHFEVPTTVGDLSDWDTCTARLAAQAPAWKAGTGHGYHTLTFGYLVGEVVRRASGKTVGEHLRDLDTDGTLNAWIGAPPDVFARVVPFREVPPSSGLGEVVAEALQDPSTLTYKSFQNPLVAAATFADERIWPAEVPAANGIFDARSLARLYSGAVDGPLRFLPKGVVDLFRTERANGPDLVLVDQPTRFGTAFALSSPRQPMLGTGSFGHDGLGGHIAFAHPESGIAFAYLSTRAVLDPTPHTRVCRLVAAVAESL